MCVSLCYWNRRALNMGMCANSFLNTSSGNGSWENKQPGSLKDSTRKVMDGQCGGCHLGEGPHRMSSLEARLPNGWMAQTKHWENKWNLSTQLNNMFFTFLKMSDCTCCHTRFWKLLRTGRSVSCHTGSGYSTPCWRIAECRRQFWVCCVNTLWEGSRHHWERGYFVKGLRLHKRSGISLAGQSLSFEGFPPIKILTFEQQTQKMSWLCKRGILFETRSRIGQIERRWWREQTSIPLVQELRGKLVQSTKSRRSGEFDF